ncbi:syntaxin of plants 51 [Rhynchospora pubera]|uniref:Syntaxin of plants 51 n=1 Tax=Rhynchospora pubera TaxID=906938 RepID=A0AAV8EKN4_9POAL|nr:syntaxin of plants 51 [Rhynchospora pubera]
MANPAELWMKEYEEASRITEEVHKMLSEYRSNPPSSVSETRKHLSSMHRSITILDFRLEKLEADLSGMPKKFIWFRKKEMSKRMEMLSNLRERERQMASVLNMWYAATDQEELIESSQGIINLQGEIMQEQDVVLDRLEEMVLITKNFALAINEELNMHTRLMDRTDEHGIGTLDSRRLRVQKRLETLNQRNIVGRSSMCLLPVLAIVILVLIAWMLAKYLKRRLQTSS